MAEIGVVDNRVVQHHEQRDDGTRAVERNDTHRRRHGLIAYGLVSAASFFAEAKSETIP